MACNYNKEYLEYNDLIFFIFSPLSMSLSSFRVPYGLAFMMITMTINVVIYALLVNTLWVFTCVAIVDQPSYYWITACKRMHVQHVLSQL